MINVVGRSYYNRNPWLDLEKGVMLNVMVGERASFYREADSYPLKNQPPFTTTPIQINLCKPADWVGVSIRLVLASVSAFMSVWVISG